MLRTLPDKFITNIEGTTGYILLLGEQESKKFDRCQKKKRSAKKMRNPYEV